MSEGSKEQLLMEKVAYGTSEISFHLKRANRKTLGIEVHPDLSVWAVAPLHSSVHEIREKILKRGAWILKQQRYFDQFLPRTPERQYVSGETHLYLGRRYILKTQKSDAQSVKLLGGKLLVSTKNNSTSEIKHELTQWYYDHGTRVFTEILEEQLKAFDKYKIDLPQLEIRRMKNRWGSCHSHGKIILNPEIIKAPKKCIEYVITHELCHLVIPNHSRAFYELQETVFPNWEKWKARLEEIMV